MESVRQGRKQRLLVASRKGTFNLSTSRICPRVDGVTQPVTFMQLNSLGTHPGWASGRLPFVAESGGCVAQVKDVDVSPVWGRSNKAAVNICVQVFCMSIVSVSLA